MTLSRLSPATIVDGASTMICDGGKMVKVVGWYDNEWGYSSRVVELIEKAHGTR